VSRGLRARIEKRDGTLIGKSDLIALAVNKIPRGGEPKAKRLLHIMAADPPGAETPIILMAEESSRRLLECLPVILRKLLILMGGPDAARNIPAVRTGSTRVDRGSARHL
jgi:hypothetical protein